MVKIFFVSVFSIVSVGTITKFTATNYIAKNKFQENKTKKLSELDKSLDQIQKGIVEVEDKIKKNKEKIKSQEGEFNNHLINNNINKDSLQRDLRGLSLKIKAVKEDNEKLKNENTSLEQDLIEINLNIENKKIQLNDLGQLSEIKQSIISARSSKDLINKNISFASQEQAKIQLKINEKVSDVSSAKTAMDLAVQKFNNKSKDLESKIQQQRINESDKAKKESIYNEEQSKLKKLNDLVAIKLKKYKDLEAKKALSEKLRNQKIIECLNLKSSETILIPFIVPAAVPKNILKEFILTENSKNTRFQEVKSYFRDDFNCSTSIELQDGTPTDIYVELAKNLYEWENNRLQQAPEIVKNARDDFNSAKLIFENLKTQIDELDAKLKTNGEFYVAKTSTTKTHDDLVKEKKVLEEQLSKEITKQTPNSLVETNAKIKALEDKEANYNKLTKEIASLTARKNEKESIKQKIINTASEIENKQQELTKKELANDMKEKITKFQDEVKKQENKLKQLQSVLETKETEKNTIKKEKFKFQSPI